MGAWKSNGVTWTVMDRLERKETADRWSMDGGKVITEEESVEVSGSRVSGLFGACKIEECL